MIFGCSVFELSFRVFRLAHVNVEAGVRAELPLWTFPFYTIQVLIILLPVQFIVKHEALLFVNVNWDPNNVHKVSLTLFKKRPDDDPVGIETCSNSYKIK